MLLGTSDFIALTRIVLTHLDGPVQTAGDTNINVNAAGNGKVNDFSVNINVVPARAAPPDMGGLLGGADDEADDV
jgi:hypothetical protein